MMEPDSAAQIIGTYLDHLLHASGFDLEYTLEVQSSVSDPRNQDSHGAPDDGSSTPAESERVLSVHFAGSDVPLLTARNAELLHAIETVAVSILRLDRAEHHRLLFDAGDLRAERTRSLELAASEAVAQVRRTGTPFIFAPMNSRERRLLHLAVAPSGLQTASTGEGFRRSVVLYPPGQIPSPSPSYTPRPRRDWPLRRSSAPTSGRPASPPRARSDSFDRTWPASPLDSEMQPRNTAGILSEGPPDQSQDERIRAIRERFRKR